jgi:hypothetical protein
MMLYPPAEGLGSSQEMWSYMEDLGPRVPTWESYATAHPSALLSFFLVPYNSHASLQSFLVL